MELQIQREKINIKKKIGEKNKTIIIEKDVILPDSKPDIIKIQSQSSNIYMNKKEKMEEDKRKRRYLCAFGYEQLSRCGKDDRCRR